MAPQEDKSELWNDIYEELHRLADRHFRGQPRDHTLQPTALVNEAFLKISRSDSFTSFDRAHFFRTAAMAMRQILIDHARRRRVRARANEAREQAEELPPTNPVDHAVELIALDEALLRLAKSYPRESQVVELRYFGGLTAEQTSEALDVSLATVGRDWAFARAWLKSELSSDTG